MVERMSMSGHELAVAWRCPYSAEREDDDPADDIVAGLPGSLNHKRNPARTRCSPNALHPQTTVGFVDVLFD